MVARGGGGASDPLRERRYGGGAVLELFVSEVSCVAVALRFSSMRRVASRAVTRTKPCTAYWRLSHHARGGALPGGGVVDGGGVGVSEGEGACCW